MAPSDASTPAVDVLLPTFNRADSLVMTLSGLAAQNLSQFRLVAADQSDAWRDDEPVIKSLIRILEARGARVDWHRRPLRRGIAEQRDYLLQQATSPVVVYLDDDVFLEPWVLGRLVAVLKDQGCAFVGAFPSGLSFRDDHRPTQELIEYWDGGVEPEAITPEQAGWERAELHRAANVYHVAQRLPAGTSRLYKVAWVACCVAYDREKLEAAGGFRFWSRLPRYHSGEEVLVQNLLLRRWGGCAIIPSGAYHSELPSTVLNESGGIDGHALDLLPEMLKQPL